MCPTLLYVNTYNKGVAIKGDEMILSINGWRMWAKGKMLAERGYQTKDECNKDNAECEP